MSSGAKQILQVAKETINGTTPDPFDRKVIPFTEISLDGTVSKAESQTIKDGRLASRSPVTGIDYAGDLSAEAQVGTYDDLIAAAAFNTWTADVLTFGGNMRQSFSMLRGYSDINNYHTFSGVHVNTFGIDIPEQDLITFSFGLMAKDRTPSASLPAGTVTPAADAPVLSSISVGDIEIDDVPTAGVACITAFSFEWDNSIQTQRCLGGGLTIGSLIETSAAGTGSFTMAWSVQGAQNYEKQFTNTLAKIEIPIVDSEGNGYLLTLPRVEFTGTLPSGGKDDLLQATFEYTVVEQAPTLTRIAPSGG